MICYFDSSALVKRYIHETDSDEVCRLLLASTPATARLSIVEITSALARRRREGDLSTAERDLAIRTLNEDMNRVYLIELSKDVSARAATLLTRHVLRAGDAIQLASCLYLRDRTGGPIQFVAHDTRLIEAGRAEGLL